MFVPKFSPNNDSFDITTVLECFLILTLISQALIRKRAFLGIANKFEEICFLHFYSRVENWGEIFSRNFGKSDSGTESHIFNFNLSEKFLSHTKYIPTTQLLYSIYSKHSHLS